MRIEGSGGVALTSVLSHSWAKKLVHGWGTHICCGMDEEQPQILRLVRCANSLRMTDSKAGSCFPTHDAMRPRHGWGTQSFIAFPGLKIETSTPRTRTCSWGPRTWGTQGHPVTERSGCRWDSHSI